MFFLGVQLTCVPLLVSMVTCDLAFRHVSSLTDVYKGATKTWFSYIESFSHFLLKELGLVHKESHSKMSRLLFRKVNFAATFVSYSKRLQHFDFRKDHRNRCNRYKVEHHRILCSSVQKASGQFVMKFQFLGEKFCFCSNFTWSFALDKRLSLNLTLLSIYFSSGAADCLRGNVSIFACGDRNALYFYCGSHSTLNVYPDVPNVAVSMFIHDDTKYALHIWFSVMDRYFLMSLQIFAPQQTLNQGPSHLLRKKLMLTFHLIQVKISHYVRISVLRVGFNFRCKVLDGPVFESDVVKRKGNSFKSSTFQCIILMLQLSALSGFEDKHFNYTSYHLLISLNIRVVDSTNVTLPLDGFGCYLNPCVVLAEADQGFHVNITLTHLMYKSSILDRTCRFGGLAVQHHASKDATQFCNNQSLSNEQNRNYYSSNASMILVLYWYEHYSSIHASLIISQTRCSPVVFEHCTSSAECGIPESLNIVFENRSITCYLSVGQCFVLQISETKTKFGSLPDHRLRGSNIFRSKCDNILVYQKPVTTPGTELRYQIKGSMEPLFSHFDWTYDREEIQFHEIKKTEEFFFCDPTSKCRMCVSNLQQIIETKLPYLCYKIQGQLAGEECFVIQFGKSEKELPIKLQMQILKLSLKSVPKSQVATKTALIKILKQFLCYNISDDMLLMNMRNPQDFCHHVKESKRDSCTNRAKTIFNSLHRKQVLYRRTSAFFVHRGLHVLSQQRNTQTDFSVFVRVNTPFSSSGFGIVLSVLPLRELDGYCCLQIQCNGNEG